MSSDLVREEELRIHALGAAISRRVWGEVESAHAAIRDKFHAAQREPEKYTVGDLTAAQVFEPHGLTDVSDLQAVLHAVESALWASSWRSMTSAPLDGTPVDLWRGDERLTDFKWSDQHNSWTKLVGYPTRTVVLTSPPEFWRPVPGAPA